MISKILKNPVYTGGAAILALIILVLYVIDDRKNPKKDFYGLLKPKTTPAVS
jgi:hypothetical protein